MFYVDVQASRSYCVHSSNSHVFQDAQFCKLCYLDWDEWKGTWDWFHPQKDASSKGWSWKKLKLCGTQVCACSVQRQESSVLWWSCWTEAPSLAGTGVSEIPATSWMMPGASLPSCLPTTEQLLVWAWDGKEWEKLLPNSLMTVMVTFDLTE